MDTRIEELERENRALKKINEVLMGRVERSIDSSGDAYALFEHNIVLQQSVEERTHELEERNRELAATLENLQNATDQLIQSEKLAALGSLVAGIAHEVNTPLGIGVTAASHLDQATQTLSEKFSSGTMRKSDLESFIATCQETVSITLTNLNRAADLITSFKKIAVDQSHESRQSIPVSEYLQDILTSLTPQLKKTSIETTIDCPPDLRIETMPGSLSQVITNLVVNALVHAFGEKEPGRISLRVQPVKDQVRIEFEDNGRGIPPEHLPKIFDPFFTTRRGQGGSGLGLHLIYNIITQGLQGSIKCESTEGEGTRFRIHLPL
jgi:signal transduction histidine kinase